MEVIISKWAGSILSCWLVDRDSRIPMISKGTKTYKNQKPDTHTISHSFIWCSKGCFHQPSTKPSQHPSLSSKQRRIVGRSQISGGWPGGRLREMARSRRRTRLEGWFVSGPPGGTSSLWSTRSGGNVSFWPICNHLHSIFFCWGNALAIVAAHARNCRNQRQIGSNGSLLL